MLLLQVNPFRDRICKVFSSSKDGDMTFEDFLDMMSTFSEAVSFDSNFVNSRTGSDFSKTIIDDFMLY